MKRKSKLILASLVALVVLYFLLCLPSIRRQAEWQRVSQALVSSSQSTLIPAMLTFVQDRKATNATVPTTVSLDELVSSGYLQAAQVKDFKRSRVTFHVGADETYPQMMVADVRLSDGSILALLADGSVQGVPPEHYQEWLKQEEALHQHQGATNDSSPSASVTNRP